MFREKILPRLQLSLSAWMLLACGLATLPLLVFALLATHRLVGQQRDAQDRELAERARAGAAAVRHVLEQPAELTIRAVAGLLPGAAIPLAQRAGCLEWTVSPPDRLRVQAGALRPVDVATLPPPAAGHGPGPAPTTLPTVQAQAYPIERGGAAARWVVPVLLETAPDRGVPGLGRSWCVDVPVSEFAAVFAEQAWPSDWTAVLIDQRGTVVARSRAPERYVGQPGAVALRELLRGGLPSGVFNVASLEGTQLRTAAAPVSDSGWVVAVGVPVASLDEALWASWRPLLGIGAASLLLGLGAAVWLARQLGLHVRRTASWSASTGWPDLDDAGPHRGAAATGPGSTGSTQPAPASPSGRGNRAPGGPGGAVVELGQLVGELRRARQEAQQASRALHGAHHDALTGLPQRTLFMQELRSRLAVSRSAVEQGDPEAAGLAVLFIDLDGFKQVNDRHGHEVGDGVLRGVSAVVRRCVRAVDVAGRLGGDEFVVVVTAPSDQVEETAQAVAQRIVHGVRALRRDIGCSIGLVCSDGRSSAEELLDSADQAMYSAKRAGKNQVVVHRRCSTCTLPSEQACTHAFAGGAALSPTHAPCKWRIDPRPPGA